MAYRIYHNPRCSKSRQTLDILRQHGVEPEVVAYLETPPDAAALKDLITKLGLPPRALVRSKDAAAIGFDVSTASNDQIVDAMAANPAIIERPIVVKGARAVLGRPPENVFDLLD